MVQVELGTELEEQLAQNAKDAGISLNEYLRRRLTVRADPKPKRYISPEERRAAVEALGTFAEERNITLGPDLTIKDLMNEGRR
jgi:hypothetical protein